LIQERGERLALLAEFVNYKKRADAEKADFMVYANNVLLKQIIEIVDDFDRAIKGSESKEEGLAEGVKMIHKKIGSLITSYGLEEIEVKEGDEFSPSNMEAVTSVDVKDKKQHNKVIEVLQKGYTNRQTGKVFKNAVVVIGKNK
jgi:molecular chaperone GrpE